MDTDGVTIGALTPTITIGDTLITAVVTTGMDTMAETTTETDALHLVEVTLQDMLLVLTMAA